MPQQFVHLHVHTPYSFLDGASEIEQIVRRAAELGMPAVTITDHNSLAAAVKFSDDCARFGVRPIYGAELTMQGGTHLTLLAQSREGYANLCRLISLAFEIGGRLSPSLPWDRLPEYAAGLICLTGCRKSLLCQLVLSGKFGKARRVVEKLCSWFGAEDIFVELSYDYTPGSLNLCRHLVEIASELQIGAVATNNVHYVSRDQFQIHDVLRCIGAGITLADDKHSARPLNAELFLKSATQMAELFSWCPSAIENTLRIAESCRCELPKHEEITPVLADIPAGETPHSFLRRLSYEGAPNFYVDVTPEITQRLDFELDVIERLGYTNFILHSWDTARAARERGIWFQLRGSAGCSLVLRCIGVSNVDPIKRNLPFARFMADWKCPDIDIDFAHDRRDEMLIYHREKHGARHVAMCCTFHTYWGKGAIRDIGKVLGLPDDVMETLRKHVSGFVPADEIEQAFARHPELQHQGALVERCKLLFSLAKQIAGFPRHLGTHSSGMIVGRIPLDSIAPTTPSAKGILPILTLDKNDAEALGCLKLDMLCLRVMSAVADTSASIRKRDLGFDYEGIGVDMDDDPETFQMIRAGQSFGSFQLESPAQMHLALMLQPSLYEDLTASIALIRPGPISSGTVRKFVSARNGYSRIELLHPVLAPILERTFGCVVFQEQVVHLIAAVTGWSEPQADRFRKRLTRHHQLGTMEEARQEFTKAALSHLSDLPFRNADLLFGEIRGWAGLGFAESHAASFAIIAAKTAHLAAHHTADYFAGLLNHQPMGYWPSNSLVAAARRNGIQTRLVDINLSDDKCLVEQDKDDESLAVRLGLRVVDGLGDPDAQAIVAARAQQPFTSLLEFAVRVPIAQDVIESLILCGAFDDLHRHRRGLLWKLDETMALARTLRVEAGDNSQLRLELGQTAVTPVAWELDDFDPWRQLMWEWRTTSVCASSHPIAWIRKSLDSRGIMTAHAASQQPNGARVTVAGLNVRPHRPGNKSNGGRHLFTSLEDETAVLQCAFYGDHVIHRCIPTILLCPTILVTGRVVRTGPGVNFEVDTAEPLTLNGSMVVAPQRYGAHAGSVFGAAIGDKQRIL